MSIEENIRSLSKQIYDKVKKVVDENKDNDDLIFSKAFLKLADGREAVYIFSIDELRVARNSRTNLKNNWLLFTVEIEGEDTKYYDYKISYETFLEENLKKNPHYSAQDLERQQSLTEKELTKVKEYYENLNMMADTITYNKRKTHTSDNFNYNLDSIYEEYMYEKEIKKMKKAGKTVLPAVETAAEWWAKQICDGVPTGSLGDESSARITETVLRMANSPKPVSKKDREKFKKVLADKLMEEVYKEKGEVIQMICDYGPHILLCKAVEETGIDAKSLNVPFKTDLYLRPYYVGVKEGYGDKVKTIFSTETKKNVEKVANIYLEINGITHEEEAEKQKQKTR